METFFIQVALEGAKLYSNEQAPPIVGESLGSLVNDYRNIRAVIDRLSQRYPSEVLEQLVDHTTISENDLQNESTVAEWCRVLTEGFAERYKPGQPEFSLIPRHDLERNIFLPNIRKKTHGTIKESLLNKDFFSSQEYKTLRDFGEKTNGLIESGGYVQRGERSASVERFEQALEWLMEEARKGYAIQRYKGLGEMNPEQLWETTMDPEVRRMLQVSIEDAIAADQMFSTLMGDNVEPRREFIENNALLVANLDV